MMLRDKPGAEEQARLVEVDEVAKALIADFSSHPALDWTEANVNRGRVLSILMQRRFLSLGFTPLYDMAIDALATADGGDDCRPVLRRILRQEYDDKTPTTHREDLVTDLVALGATRDAVLETQPSSATRRTVEVLLELLVKSEEWALHRIQVLALVWFAAEVLVSMEYEMLWPAMQALGLRRDKKDLEARGGGTVSVFYFPHMGHDKPRFRLSGRWPTLDSWSHADKIAHCLRNAVLDGPGNGADHCCAVLRRCTAAKRAFYDQFPRVENGWAPND